MRRYKYDLHVHTKESSACGRIAGRKLVDLYREAGYDGIVITDHFYPPFFAKLGSRPWEEKVDRYLAGYRAAAARGREIGLVVLFGLELKFAGGDPNDYLVYGVDEGFLKENSWILERGLEQFHQACRESGFLVYQAHPFRPELEVADPGRLDGVETYNGNRRHDSRNHLAQRFARENGLRAISGSDCHQREDLGRGGVELGERVESMTQLVRLLMEGRVEGLITAP